MGKSHIPMLVNGDWFVLWHDPETGSNFAKGCIAASGKIYYKGNDITSDVIAVYRNRQEAGLTKDTK